MTTEIIRVTSLSSGFDSSACLIFATPAGTKASGSATYCIGNWVYSLISPARAPQVGEPKQALLAVLLVRPRQPAQALEREATRLRACVFALNHAPCPLPLAPCTLLRAPRTLPLSPRPLHLILRVGFDKRETPSKVKPNPETPSGDLLSRVDLSRENHCREFEGHQIRTELYPER